MSQQQSVRGNNYKGREKTWAAASAVSQRYRCAGCPAFTFYSSWKGDAGGYIPLLSEREVAWRGASEERLMWELLRERDSSEETLPLDTMLPSCRRGDPGTYEVAVPFGASYGASPPCVFMTGWEKERFGEMRAGEYCPARMDDSRLRVSGDGREARMPREDEIR